MREYDAPEPSEVAMRIEDFIVLPPPPRSDAG